MAPHRQPPVVEGSVTRGSLSRGFGWGGRKSARPRADRHEPPLTYYVPGAMNVEPGRIDTPDPRGGPPSVRTARDPGEASRRRASGQVGSPPARFRLASPAGTAGGRSVP